MGPPGLDAITVLDVLTVLYWAAWMFSGLAWLGFLAYLVFVLGEILSPEPASGTRQGEERLRVAGVPRMTQMRVILRLLKFNLNAHNTRRNALQFAQRAFSSVGFKNYKGGEEP